MISAIVLCSDDVLGRRDAREVVVRSLSWLVSAVVAGVVRDVTIAGSSELDLEDIADRVGCELVQADHDAERLRASGLKAKCPRLLIVKAGYQPDGQLAEEVDARGGTPIEATAHVLAAPSTFIERLLPNLTPIVGVLAPKTLVVEAASFEKLARACRGGARLTSRARPIF